MKIPGYIDNALKKRTRLALYLEKQCSIVDDWLNKNNIDPDTACWLGGVEIYVNPYVAEDEVRRSIENA